MQGVLTCSCRRSTCNKGCHLSFPSAPQFHVVTHAYLEVSFMDSQETIQNTVLACSRDLELLNERATRHVAGKSDGTIAELLIGNPATAVAISNLRERLEQWATNVGVFKDETSPFALKKRIAPAFHILEQISTALQRLRAALRRAVRIAWGETSDPGLPSLDDVDYFGEDGSSSAESVSDTAFQDIEDSACDLSESATSGTELDELLRAIECHMTSLYRLTAFFPNLASGDTATNKRIQRLLLFSNTDSTQTSQSMTEPREDQKGKGKAPASTSPWQTAFNEASSRTTSGGRRSLEKTLSERVKDNTDNLSMRDETGPSETRSARQDSSSHIRTKSHKSSSRGKASGTRTAQPEGKFLLDGRFRRDGSSESNYGTDYRWWITDSGVDRDILQIDIGIYLGPFATARPARHPEASILSHGFIGCH